MDSIKDSKLVEAIGLEIGEVPVGFICYFPPLLLLAPVFLLIWVTEMIKPVSASFLANLLAIAETNEREALINVSKKDGGRYWGFDLWRLRNKIRKQAWDRKEAKAVILLDQAQKR